MEDDFAVVSGRVLTGLTDLTSDPGALDSRGLWAVVVPFSGPPVCARFGRSGPAADLGWPGPGQWHGPERGSWSTSIDRSGFVRRVSAVRQAIAAGDVYQVNLCRRLSAPWPNDGEIAALGRLLGARHPAPHAAILHLPSAGVHLASASPERFLRRQGALVESRPIKGTAARPGAFLPKDRAENVMIVDLVRNDLGRVCEYGTVEVDGLCEVERHPGLAHLVSTVKGRLRAGVGWSDLLDAAFPPGSVTGAPKRAALHLIEQLEPVARAIYCGAVGWVDADSRRGDLNVAIRTFWRDGDRLCFGTGGAITWDSVADAEWEETELKAARLVGLASTDGVRPEQPSLIGNLA